MVLCSSTTRPSLVIASIPRKVANGHATVCSKVPANVIAAEQAPLQIWPILVFGEDFRSTILIKSRMKWTFRYFLLSALLSDAPSISKFYWISHTYTYNWIKMVAGDSTSGTVTWVDQTGSRQGTVGSIQGCERTMQCTGDMFFLSFDSTGDDTTFDYSCTYRLDWQSGPE
jgi:hypothetical protein